MWLRSLWLSLAVSLYFVSWVGELFRQSWQSAFPLSQLTASFFFQQASRCGKRQKKLLILLIPGSGHQKTSCSSTILSSKQQIRAVFGDSTQKVIGKIMLVVISQSTVKAHLEMSSLHSTMLKCNDWSRSLSAAGAYLTEVILNRILKRMVLQLASLWKWKSLELGNGLLANLLVT